jgi:hypothetical protein
MILKIKDSWLLLFLFFFQNTQGQIDASSANNMEKYLVFKKYKSSDFEKIVLFKIKDTFDILSIDNFLQHLGYNATGKSSSPLQIQADSGLVLSKENKKILLSILTSPGYYKRSYKIRDTTFLDGYSDCFIYDHCIVAFSSLNKILFSLILSHSCNNLLFVDFLNKKNKHCCLDK